MDLAITRIILFTANMVEMARFYRDVVGLEQTSDERGWKEFSAGGCSVALHNGTSKIGTKAPKLVFHSKNVAQTREMLVKRGAKMGLVKSKDGLDLCDGRDPDRNAFQISNRA